MLPLFALATAGVVHPHRPNALFGVVHAQKPACRRLLRSLLLIVRLAGVIGRLFDPCAFRIQEDHILDIDCTGSREQQFAAALVERKTGADLDRAGIVRCAMARCCCGLQTVAIYDAPAMNRAIEQSAPLEQVTLFDAERVGSQTLAFEILVTQPRVARRIGTTRLLRAAASRGWFMAFLHGCISSISLQACADVRSGRRDAAAALRQSRNAGHGVT